MSRQRRKPLVKSPGVALLGGCRAQTENLTVGVGNVTVLAKRGNVRQHVGRALSSLGHDLVDHDQGVEVVQRLDRRVAVGMEQDRVVARDQQRLQRAVAGRCQHASGVESTLTRDNADIAQADGVGLGRQDVERCRRSLGAGQCDRKVGRSANLSARLGSVDPRRRHDDRDRTTTSAEDRRSGGLSAVGIAADICEAVKAGQPCADIEVLDDRSRQRLRHSGEVAVDRMNRVRFVDRVVGKRIASRRDADQRRAVVRDRVLDPHAKHVVRGRDVVANGNDQVGSLDRGQARRQMLRAKRVVQCVADGGGDGAQRGVEVGDANASRKGLERIELFQRGLAGAKDADGGWPVLLKDRAQCGGGMFNDRVAVLLECVFTATNGGGAQAVLVASLVVAEASAYADLRARDIVAVARPDLDAASVAHAHLNRAAH